MRKPRILLVDACRWGMFFSCLLFFPWLAQAQYPQYFLYDDESGLPSNEVYSIVQDPRGFTWIGSDAGLYKYDGVRYIPYRSAAQRSKSVTGLTLSASGRLYCINFQSQVFYVEGDTLRELLHGLSNIPSIAANDRGSIFFNHQNGLAEYNEQTGRWKQYTGFGRDNPYGNKMYTRAVHKNDSDQVYFLCTSGLGVIDRGQLRVYATDVFARYPPGEFVMACRGTAAWMFCPARHLVFVFDKGQISPVSRPGLQAAILNRKITHARFMPDGSLWICTYNGMIRYDTRQDRAEVFFPDFSFSDVLCDREGHYWMSTLQAGILRIPGIDHPVWNRQSAGMPGEKITRVMALAGQVYFTTVNGYVGRLDTADGSVNTFQVGTRADIQALDYDRLTDEVLFSINNNLYALKNNRVQLLQTGLPPVKSVLHTAHGYLLGTSFGTFLHDLASPRHGLQLSPAWSRDFAGNDSLVWVAANKGLLCFERDQQGWKQTRVLLSEKQVLGVEAAGTGLYYALCFDGKVWAIDAAHRATETCALPKGVQACRFTCYHGYLYMATNKGVWIYDTVHKSWENIGKLDGLASDNVQDLDITGNHLWLATGRGLQRWPLHTSDSRQRARIYLKNIRAGNRLIGEQEYIALDYGQTLYLAPEASAYSSHGHFRYAYRIVNRDSTWNYLPASIENIWLANIPAGRFTIELKAVDYRGRDSENTIRLRGEVKPPFWSSGWFYALVLALLLLVFYFLFRYRIGILRRRQQREIDRLQLENELRLTRQTALRAQMNPHFIFNVLNSIKGYIYKNDKQNASAFLSSFSDLIRIILDMSSRQQVAVEDELAMLELYIQLEGMMLGDDFTFTKNISPDIYHHEIPTMLLQPFIENAFKHGLRHQRGPKQLSLHMYLRSESEMVIEITDNGIGRNASYTLRQQQNPGHRSFATGAIEKRVDLINREGSQQVTVTIKDLADAQGKALGTSVVLNIVSKDA